MLLCGFIAEGSLCNLLIVLNFVHIELCLKSDTHSLSHGSYNGLCNTQSPTFKIGILDCSCPVFRMSSYRYSAAGRVPPRSHPSKIVHWIRDLLRKNDYLIATDAQKKWERNLSRHAVARAHRRTLFCQRDALAIVIYFTTLTYVTLLSLVQYVAFLDQSVHICMCVCIYIHTCTMIRM